VCPLAGTQICAVAGRELRGMTVDEMHHGNPKVRSEFETVARDWMASYVERSMG
jgi:hypothetical protein